MNPPPRILKARRRAFFGHRLGLKRALVTNRRRGVSAASI